jgi:hypothetical protein
MWNSLKFPNSVLHDVPDFLHRILTRLQITELSDFAPKPNETYNINLPHISLGIDCAPNFRNICQAIKTSTRPTTLHINFWLEEVDLQLLGETVAESQSFSSVSVTIDRALDVQAFKKFATSIAKNKKVKTIRFTTRGSKDILGSIKGLYMPMSFLVFLESCPINTNELYLNLVEMLKSTNVNKLELFEETVYAPTIHSALTGFSEFCNHVIKQNTTKELKLELRIDDFTLPYLAKLIASTTSLRILDIVFSAKVPEKLKELLDALAKSQIRRLSFSGLEENNSAGETYLNIAKSIRSMEKLTSADVTIYHADIEQFLNTIRESESLRHFLMRNDNGFYNIENICLRNKKLQNTRVLALITVLFNIARDTSSHFHPIQRDLWPSIVSFVSIPGVSLDFGNIARSIFKDHSVRRVIDKPRKR